VDLRVERSITVSAPATLAFAQVNDLRKWPQMSPYAKDDPAAKYTFAGPAAGVGSTLEWAGNAKVGAGRMTITDSRPGELVRFKFEFFKPWYCTNTTDFVFRTAPAPRSPCPWNNFIAKASGLVMNMDKLMGESYEAGLVNLKNLRRGTAGAGRGRGPSPRAGGASCWANHSRAGGSPWVRTMLRAPGLDRELEELLAVGVAAQLEALDPRLDLRLHVRRLEEERLARLRREELAAGRVGVAVADEADRVAALPRRPEARV
jgi:hypothetical protein